jgi:UrcA family protein
MADADAVHAGLRGLSEYFQERFKTWVGGAAMLSPHDAATDIESSTTDSGRQQMNTRNALKAGYGLLAMVALLSPGLARAASVAAPDIRVPYQRTALDTVEGAGALLKRIEKAAARVCAPLDHVDVATRARRDDCRRILTETAVRDVNHPLLMTVYASRHQASSRLLAVTK